MAITYQTIATATLESPSASIQFSPIPNTYTDLILMISARTTRANIVDAIAFEINNNTTNGDYGLAFGWGFNNGQINGAYLNTRLEEIAYVDGANAPANKFGTTIVKFAQYTSNTRKHFTVQSAAMNNETTTARWNFGGGTVNITSAITSIKILPVTGPNLAALTSATLYGVLKA